MPEPTLPRRVTIREVAAAAGVSTATVSLAMNGRGTVSDETARRVVRIADELGYRPSRTARALRMSRSGILAIVLPPAIPGQPGLREPSFEYYLRLIGGASRHAFEQDERLLLAPPLRTRADVRDLGADGVILCDPERDDEQLGLCLESGLPVVTVEPDPGRPDFAWHAGADNAASMRLLLDHLAARGAARVGVVGAPWDNGWMEESAAAYADWCVAHGQVPRLERVHGGGTFTEAAERTAGAMLDAARPPDAIIAMAERCARGVIRAATRRGLRVPDDLLVAAAMDSAAEREGEPAITTVDLDPDRLGQAVIELLRRRIDGDEAERPVLVPAELRVRASTGGP